MNMTSKTPSLRRAQGEADIVREDSAPAGHPRNSVQPYDAAAFEHLRINLSAAEKRVATLKGRRSVKKDAQAAWLLKAITCIDLTTLSGDDTPQRVRRLCAKAANPSALPTSPRYPVKPAGCCFSSRFLATFFSRSA